MDEDVKRQFIRATLHFKKVDMCELSRGSIPFGEMVVMGWVQQQCPVSGGCLNVAEIASQLCVSRPAVSQMLSSLEGKGYIVRQIDPSDRRRITVYSTETGNRVLQESQQRYDAAVDRFLNSMTVEELETLTRLMNRLTRIFNDMKSNPEEGDKK